MEALRQREVGLIGKWQIAGVRSSWEVSEGGIVETPRSEFVSNSTAVPPERAEFRYMSRCQQSRDELHPRTELQTFLGQD